MMIPSPITSMATVKMMMAFSFDIKAILDCLVGDIKCNLTSTTISCNMTTMTSKDKQRVTLFLNPKLLTHAKAQAVIEDITLTALVEKVLVEYLPEQIVIVKPKLK